MTGARESTRTEPKKENKHSTVTPRPSVDPARKAALLKPKDANVPSSNPSKAVKVSSHAHGPTSSSRHALPTLAVNVSVRSIYSRNIDLSAILKAEADREDDLGNLISQGNNNINPLHGSYMSGRASTSASGSGNRDGDVKMTDEDAEADFLNVFNISALGKFTRMWVKVYFGDVSNRSMPCELAIDSGSSTTWINKTIYDKALKKGDTTLTPATPWEGKSFQISYNTAGKIKGKLYKDTISFLDKNASAEGQIFGIVDEEKCAIAKEWNEKEQNIKGVLGIGPKTLKSTILGRDQRVIKNLYLPTVLDNMQDQRKVSAKIIGINFGLPKEGTEGAGGIDGTLHIGGPQEGAFNLDTMRMIPATQKGISDKYYGIDLTLKYNRKTIMDDKPGVIDSGSSFIMLPEAVLDAYVAAVGNCSNGKSIITYDTAHGLYYIAKADFKRLKPLEFDFVKGKNAKFMLSPVAQVIPPVSAKRFTVPLDHKDRLYLIFRRLNSVPTADKKKEARRYQFILGLGWLIWYYVVLDSSSTTKKIGVAEIDGRKDFKWEGLP